MLTQILSMASLVTLYEEQAVPVPHLGRSLGTLWDGGGLTVTSNEESRGRTGDTCLALGSWETRVSW